MSAVEQPIPTQNQPAPRRRRVYPKSAGPTVAPLPGVIQASPALLKGRHLTCPGCEEPQDVLTYTPFELSEKYADQVIPVYRCRECGHVFALDPTATGDENA